MRSITVKLILSFLVIGLTSVAIIIFLARQNTQNEFNRFMAGDRGEDLVASLATYYQINHSWEGVGVAFAPGTVPVEPGSTPYPSFTIADENGKALIDGAGHHTGEIISSHELSFSIPIQVDGNTVGTLVMERAPFPGNSREEEFIQRTNTLLIYSGLSASLVALLLGIFLSRTLTRPIRELTTATHAVSEGDLDQRVPVRSKDELGELARAFNKMSSELSHSINSRKQMTADIAHELRTPLSLILGHAEAVHDGVLPASLENFEIIREEASRLEHLVDELRTLSLADAGELSLRPETVSPEQLLQEVANLYHFHTKTRDMKLELDISPHLPNLEIDPGRMTQVLTNILDNALRHTPSGGKVTLAAHAVPGWVELSVQDSGPGLPTEDLPRIFDRFYRADESRRRDKGGSGLGLAIAKSIVTAHGGQIRGESEPGKGLAIIISLPVKK